MTVRQLLKVSNFRSTKIDAQTHSPPSDRNQLPSPTSVLSSLRRRWQLTMVSYFLTKKNAHTDTLTCTAWPSMSTPHIMFDRIIVGGSSSLSLRPLSHAMKIQNDNGFFIDDNGRQAQYYKHQRQKRYSTSCLVCYLSRRIPTSYSIDGST